MIVFRCPECQEKFEVESRYGGRKWRCTSCQASITIPEPGAEPDDEGRRRRHVENDEPAELERRPGRDRDDDGNGGAGLAAHWPGWAVTRVGVRVLGTGVSIFLVSWVFLVAAKYITEGQGPQNFAGPQAQAGILFGAATVFGLAVIVFVTLFVTGQGICCQVPAPGSARVLAVASVMGSVMSVVMLIVILFVATSEAQVGARLGAAAGTVVLTRVLLWIAIAFAAVGLSLYLFFLAAVVRHFQQRALGVVVILEFVVALLFIVYLIVLQIVRGPQALALLSGNIRNGAGVGRAVEITFFVHMGVVSIGLFVILSLVGSAIRKPRSLRARHEG